MRKFLKVILFILFCFVVIVVGFWAILFFKIPLQLSGLIGIIQGVILVVVFIEFVYD